MTHPRTIGPYRILKVLGGGGMGIVYHAMHRQSAERVALKTVRVPDAALFETLRREIHALARLEHPGIVKVVAEGVHEGMPWYAMELLAGTSLAEYVRAVFDDPEEPRGAGDAEPTVALGPSAVLPGPPGLEGARPRARRPPAAGGELVTALTLVRRLCAPLAYMHGEGLVHRDLKPDNILVRTDGRPVVVDFGLTSSFTGEASRDRFELGGSVSGTVAYMAPEQARGEIVDARADLYALGCILYELVCGRPPFVAEQASAVLYQHLRSEAEPASAHAEDVPAGLDALLRRLLAKDPRERLGYAEDVARELERLGAQADGGEAVPAKCYLHRPRLAGREEVLGALDDRIGELRGGRGGVVLVTGVSGVGKTRLLADVATRARAFDVRVLVGLCEESQEASPLHPLRPVLRAVSDICRELGAPATDRILGARGKVLAVHEPLLATLPGQDAFADPPPVPADEGRERLQNALTRTLQELARQGPCLLVLDDLQWSDELTLSWIERVVRDAALAAVPVLLLGTARSEEMRPTLDAIATRAVHVPLPAIPEGAVGAMVRDMLALAEAPPHFAAFLALHAQGNPLFVAEYLRLAVAEGVLLRDNLGVWRLPGGTTVEDAPYERLPLPRSLQEVLGRRLAGLGPDASELCAVASVIGKEIDPGVLARACRLPEEVRRDAERELQLRHVLRPAGDRLEFSHDKLRAVSYDALPEARRASFHGAVAEALEALPPEARADRLAEMGRHWQLAGDAARAGDCYLAASERALARYAVVEGGEMLRAFLRLQDRPGARSLRARLDLWQHVLRLRGPLSEAEVELSRAAAEAKELGLAAEEGEAWGGLGVLLSVTGKPEDALTAYDRALAIVRARGNEGAEGVYLGNRGGLLLRLGRTTEARESFERTLAIHRRLGQKANEGMAINSLAIVLSLEGRLAESAERHAEALGMMRDAGARLYEGMVLGALAEREVDLGRLADALGHYQEALAIHREVGNSGHEALVLGRLGTVTQELGRRVEATTHFARALEIAATTGNRRLQASLLTEAAAAAVEQGRSEAARSDAAAALRMGEDLGDEGIAGPARSVLADVAFAEGDLLGARSLYEKVRDAAAGPPSTAHALARLGRLAWLLDRDPGAAATLFAEARRTLEGSAALSVELGRLACLEARTLAEAGADASDAIARAESIVAALALPPESPLSRDVGCLREDPSRTGGKT